VTAASPLPRYGAIEERARSRPCYRQLHHHPGHDLAACCGAFCGIIWTSASAASARCRRS